MAVVFKNNHVEVLEFCWQGERFRVQVTNSEIRLLISNPVCPLGVQQQALQRLLAHVP